MGAAAAVALVLGLMAGQAGAVEITVDGHAGDWGISLGAGTSADWVPYAGIQGYWDWGNGEDYISGGGGYLDPGWGGQSFDAEALYFTYDDEWAYFAVATGFPPSGLSHNDPGDIAIDIGCDSTWDFGIETTGNDHHKKGGLYATDNWDWTTPSNSISFPSELKCSADKVWSMPCGNNLIYTTCSTNGHYFIEAKVPIENLNLPDDECTRLKAHWTMSCGNDAVETNCMTYCPPTPETPGDVIPEPATCTLLGSGFLAALALRVRKRKKAKERQAA
jgi:hypothetical protein